MLMRKYTPPKCTHDRKTVADRCTDACHRLKDMVVKSDAPAGYRVTLKARADNYRPVAIDCVIPLGEFAEVEITDCAATYLHGKIL